jgi:hypothetical protein
MGLSASMLGIFWLYGSYEPASKRRNRRKKESE